MPTELALTNDQAAINGSAHREPISSFSTPGNGYTDERDDMRCASLIQAGFRWSVHGPGYRRGTPRPPTISAISPIR